MSTFTRSSNVLRRMSPLLPHPYSQSLKPMHQVSISVCLSVHAVGGGWLTYIERRAACSTGHAYAYASLPLCTTLFLAHCQHMSVCHASTTQGQCKLAQSRPAATPACAQHGPSMPAPAASASALPCARPGQLTDAKASAAQCTYTSGHRQRLMAFLCALCGCVHTCRRVGPQKRVAVPPLASRPGVVE
jgi:hypothetical protein